MTETLPLPRCLRRDAISFLPQPRQTIAQIAFHGPGSWEAQECAFMIANRGRPKVWRPLIASLSLALGAFALHAGTATAKPGETMEKVSGTVWVEGPGYDITYGGNYEKCVARCLGVAKCVMIEYYRPELKCNMHATLRPRKSGGSSYVAIRRTSPGTTVSAAQAEPQLLEPPKQVTRASSKRDSRDGRAVRESRDPRSSGG